MQTDKFLDSSMSIFIFFHLKSAISEIYYINVGKNKTHLKKKSKHSKNSKKIFKKILAEVNKSKIF